MDGLQQTLESLIAQGLDFGIDATSIPLILGGIALLLFGRRLYWLAVGGLGAALAVILASHLTLPSPEARLLLAVVAAIAGAILALTAQKLVVSAVGFLTGAAFGAWLIPLFWPDAGLWLIAGAIAAGIFGLLISTRLFDALLIVGTSAAGSWLIIGVIPELLIHSMIALPIGVLIGCVLQTRKGKKRSRKDDD